MNTMQTIPAHVPAELVRHGYRFGFLASITNENPFKTMIPQIHEWPEIFYSPVVYVGGLGGWVPRRLEDIRAIYLDTEHFSNKGWASMAPIIGETWSMIPTELDPPEHGAFRAVLNPLFTPRKLSALDDKVRKAANSFIEKFKANGECEFVSEFAFKFPIVVILDLLNLPHSRMDEFLTWEGMLLHSEDFADVAKGLQYVTTYLREVIEDRKRNPGDDLVSFSTTATVGDRAWTDDEILGFFFNLYIGGLDTVSTNLCWQFRHLAENPAHQARLRSNPDFIPTALEELYRAYAAVTTFRVCVKEVVINGVKMMPGDKVALPTPLANSDPSAWDNPSDINLERGATHVAFGYGIHRCLGAPLARRESCIAIEEFLKAIPEFRIKPGAELPTILGGVIQPKSLPLVWK